MGSEIDKLIEAVDGGEVAHTITVWPAIGDDWPTAYRAYHGSLDAAKALHEALLPGWEWWRSERGLFGVGIGFEEHFGRSNNPACSWLLAILKAYRAQQQEDK